MLVIIFVFIIILDVIFFAITKQHFIDQIEAVQKKPFNITWNKMLTGLLCYMVIALTITSMPVISPYKGFIIGCTVYSIFELTCYTIFEDWKISTIILDTIWGGIVFASAFQLIKWINNYNGINNSKDDIHPASVIL